MNLARLVAAPASALLKALLHSMILSMHPKRHVLGGNVFNAQIQHQEGRAFLCRTRQFGSLPRSRPRTSCEKFCMPQMSGPKGRWPRSPKRGGGAHKSNSCDALDRGVDVIDAISGALNVHIQHPQKSPTTVRDSQDQARVSRA